MEMLYLRNFLSTFFLIIIIIESFFEVTAKKKQKQKKQNTELRPSLHGPGLLLPHISLPTLLLTSNF